jgi:hypothetical protein
LEIRFIDHLQVASVSNNDIIANFHNLQITTAHAESSQSVFTSRFPITDLNNEDSSASLLTALLTAPTESSFHRPPYNSVTAD